MTQNRSEPPEPLESAVSTAVRRAQSSGCDEFEVSASRLRTRRVGARENAVKGGTSSNESSVVVRVVVGGRVGTAFSNSFSRAELLRTVDNACAVAKVMRKDSSWTGMPVADTAYPYLKGCFDSRVRSLGIRELKSVVESVIGSALSFNPKITVTDVDVASTVGHMRVVNSSGIDVSGSSTRLNSYCSCVVGTGENVTPDCFTMQSSRSFDIDLEALGERSSMLATLSCTQAEPRTEECEVVFSPMALGAGEMGILSFILSRALSGESLVRKETFLAGLKGRSVAADCITIEDNPLDPRRAGSRAFDDEGVPARRTRLIFRGNLEGFLWNSYFAAMAGEKTTGNSVRNPVTGSVRVAPLNLTIRAGKGSMEKSISEVDHGYFIWACQGAHTSNSITGDFSFVASPGFMIKHGEIVGGVRGAMISGNLLRLLRNATSVGSDLTDFGGAVMPSISFENVRVTTG